MKRYIFGVLALSLTVALASWGWYLVARAPRTKYSKDAGVPTFAVRPAEPNPSSEAASTWRAATPKERSAAIRSIIAQLEAFKADDYERATTYQSRGLKGNFSSVKNFRHMITENYPQFAHYKKASFGATLATRSGEAVQAPIILTGQDGVTVHAVYLMALENGVYRVMSVSGGLDSSGGNLREPHSQPKVPPGFEKVAPLLT